MFAGYKLHATCYRLQMTGNRFSFTISSGSVST